MDCKLAFALAAFATGAAAQEVARPDPADPRVALPAVPYHSAFEGYRRYTEQEPGRWREVNEEAGRLGGHVGQVRVGPAQGKPKPERPKDQPHGSHR